MQTLFRIGWYRAHRLGWTEGSKPLVSSRLRTSPTKRTIRRPQMCASNSQLGGGIIGPCSRTQQMRTKNSKRYRAAQIAVDVDKNPLQRLFPKGHMNKLGLIIKESPEKRKLRIVVDMRIDVPAQTHERQCPSVRSCLARATLWQTGRNCFQKLLLWVSQQILVSLAKMSRATFRMHTVMFWCTRKNSRIVWSRLRLLPSGFDQNVALMCRMGFGSKGAPLTWCRIAAALGRVAQAMLMGARRSGHAAGRVNTFFDGPLLNLLGTQTQRDKQLRAVLLFWTAAGFKVAWAKGTRSKVAKWIGLEFAPDFQSHTVAVRIPAKTANAFKQDAQELLVAPMFPLKKLRRFAGKGGWIMYLLPKGRWTIQRCWEAIAEEERPLSSLKAGKARRHTRGGKRNHLIARRQALDFCL